MTFNLDSNKQALDALFSGRTNKTNHLKLPFNGDIVQKKTTKASQTF